MTIRAGRSDDLEAIVTMTGHFLRSSPYGAVLAFVPEAVRELAQRVLTLGVCFVAEVDGRLVGMIAGFAMAEPIARTKMLDELAWFVEPGYRSGTVGPRLLRAWEQWAREQDLEGIRMLAPHGSPAVGAFYERRGYRLIELAYWKRLR